MNNVTHWPSHGQKPQCYAPSYLLQQGSLRNYLTPLGANIIEHKRGNVRSLETVSGLHTRANQSARNTSGESITYIRQLNDLQQRCLQKFINICMVDGKKTKSHLIITNTFARLANYGDVIAFVMNAIENVKPIIEIKKVRISGSTQLVPSLISTRRQETLAIRWIVEAAIQRRKAKQSLNLEQCLFAEIVDASNKIGVVRKKRDELHKLAEANRGFAHYRWW